MLNSFHFVGDDLLSEIVPIEEEKEEISPPKSEKYALHESIMPKVIKEGISFPTAPPNPQKMQSPQPDETPVSSETIPQTPEPLDETENDFSASTTPDEQEKILNLIKHEGAQNVDSVCTKLGISFRDASVLMVEMELMGLIQNSERDLYVLSSGDNSN